MCADSLFFEGLETCLISIIAYSHRHTGQFNFYCIDSPTQPSHRENLEKIVAQVEKKFDTQVVLHWIEFDPDAHDGLDQLKGSYSYYVRLYLADLIPDQDWVVWIDSDMFCMKDLSNISSYLDDSTPAFGVIDPVVTVLAKDMGDIEILNTRKLDLNLPYLNSGFLLLNLKTWREEGLTKKLISWAIKYSHASTFHDQSVINWTLADRIKLLPIEYNTVDISILDEVTSIGVDALPQFVNYHATGKNKLWMLNFQQTLKHAAHESCRMIMTHEYLKFRSDHMEFNENERLSRLHKAILQHPYLKQTPSPLFIYNLKILLYTLTGNRRLQRHWKQSKAHYVKHASTMCQAMRRLAQEIEAST